ncbi:N-acetylmuramoyl-L-alanine amidase [Nocardia stercoris]|uniref:Cold-shock protein n=1 Tax=Nocardia stercoris TaxID=2483361 RepID=A0A3M2L9E7_9NOCA|nr:N-acetylmuramoyl-L-alanine amidase [Nocardia stercoris]RMI34199.1 hypothetical protein EBN03_07210 [Nocardia stercoris]
MPHHRPRYPLLLPVVTSLAATVALTTFLRSGVHTVRPADNGDLASVTTNLAEVALSGAPEVLLPLPELRGLTLPDLHLSDLRKLPLPTAIPIPHDLPVPPGVQLPEEVPLPHLPVPQAVAPLPHSIDQGTDPAATTVIPDPAPGPDYSAPALEPGAVPPDLADRLGAQVREITRDTPFSMVALTGTDLHGLTALIRTRHADGSWSEWNPLDTLETAGNDRVQPTRTGTEPLYVGPTTGVQILTTRPGHIHVPDLSAVLIDPGRGAVDGMLEATAATVAGGPKVITRKQWGADESLRCQDPTYDDSLGGITVHHSAGRNEYTKAESAGIVRAIYAYHAKTLGWCDIGYNALVDKYGQIFEGRYGGLDKPVEGAHAGGFNENTAGVAMLGNFTDQPPTDAQLQATGQFIGWRAKLAGLDPQGTTTMYSEGTQYTSYPEGQAVQLPVVFAHRDVGKTACPGDAAYALLPKLRAIAASVAGNPNPAAGPALSDPEPDSPTQPAPSAAPARPQRSPLQRTANPTEQLLNLVGSNPIATYWAASGAATGPLGDATALPRPAGEGGQFATFANGYVYSGPGDTVTELTGPLLDRYLELGADSGLLGLPTRSPYPGPDGTTRADFRYGSLILDPAANTVSTIVNAVPDSALTTPEPDSSITLPDSGIAASTPGSTVAAPVPDSTPIPAPVAGGPDDSAAPPDPPQFAPDAPADTDDQP